MTPERKFEIRSEAARFRVRDYPGIAEMLDEALDEIERVQRERDALLKLHRAVYEAFTEDPPPELQDAVKRAHDEASRVLADDAREIRAERK